METLPLVSCIMPTYNRRRFVPRAIEHFLRQDHELRKLIVIYAGGDLITIEYGQLQNSRLAAND